jgi:hypothetical protein
MLRKLFRRTIVGDEKAPKELEACLGRPGKESRSQSIQTLKFSSAIAPNGAPGILGHLFQKIPLPALEKSCRLQARQSAKPHSSNPFFNIM